MTDKNYILVDNETKAIETLSELKRQGINENNMYVIHNKGEKIAILGTKVDIETIQADDDDLKTDNEKSMWEKFTDFFTGEDRVEKALDDTKLGEKDKEDLLLGVRNGKIALLIDNDYRDSYSKTCREYQATDEARKDKLKEGYDPFLGINPNDIF